MSNARARIGDVGRPPGALPSRWVREYRRSLDRLREDGSWRDELKPLLDEYVLALNGAEAARAVGDGREWDRCVRRAQALADQLALSERGRRAAGVGVERGEAPADPFADLDAAAVSVEAAPNVHRLPKRAS